MDENRSVGDMENFAWPQRAENQCQKRDRTHFELTDIFEAQTQNKTRV